MGVFKALLEVGIPLDYIAGTSMGAIMAGVIANEYTYEKYEELSQYCADLGVTDYTLPYAALNTSDHVTKICTNAFKDRLIEDLWIPFFCNSTNLSRAEKKVHQRGPLWRAIRSSMSIPGLFLPVLDNGDILVDGGVIDNYPVESMRNIAEPNRIIGVNITPHREEKFNFDYDTSISGWRIFLNRLNPFSKNIRIPSITDVLWQSFVINNKRSSIDQESLADLTIYPDARGYSMGDYKKWREIAQCGYDKAIKPLQKWKERQPDLLD
jgi:predicted acylesterase/phospholipase RssA